VNLIYAVDTEAVADAAEKISRADIPADTITAILLKALMGNSTVKNPYGP